jgi:CubicO group peptidase (beta-lactamase class C family)
MRLQTFILYLIFISLIASCDLNGKGKKSEGAIFEKDTSLNIPEMPGLTKDYIRRTRRFAYFFYKDEIAKDRFSGSFLVAKNGHIVYERTSGYSNFHKKKRIDFDTPLHVASISKVATSLAVLRLCDRKQIDLDKDVREYLREFPYEGITVRMLLTHRSGIQYYGYFTFKTWNLGITLKNKDVLSLLIEHKFPLNFPPGSKFSYCNTNYALLALIIERVNGKSFPKSMEELVFYPLKMKNSFILDHMIDTDTISQSYNSKWELQAFNYLDAVHGDKNLYTTARDILKMDNATYSTLFLSDSMRKQMLTGYSYKKRSKGNYGLGIRMVQVPTKEIYYFHTGWWHGSTGCYATLRADSTCIIAISNKYTRSVYRIKNLAPYFGDYPFEFLYED